MKPNRSLVLVLVIVAFLGGSAWAIAAGPHADHHPMPGGMSMMAGMAPGGQAAINCDMPERHQMMEKRMEMMQMMMQMMMDRLPEASTK